MARVFTGVLLVALASATAAPVHAERTRKPAVKAARTPEQRQALDHLREGQRLMRAESFEAAAREFGLAVRLDPLLVMAHYGRGQAQMALKDFPAAIQAYLQYGSTLQEMTASCGPETALLMVGLRTRCGDLPRV